MVNLEIRILDELIHQALVEANFHQSQFVISVPFWRFKLYEKLIKKGKVSRFFGGEPIVIANNPPYKFDEMKFRVVTDDDQLLFTARTKDYHFKMKEMGI
jgi:hypothetical protein